MKETVLLFCGPAASGKDTLLNAFQQYCIDHHYDFHRIVCDTTRPMRDHEVDGVDYYFLSQNDFLNKYPQQYITATEFRHWFYGIDKTEIRANKINLCIGTLSDIINLHEAGYNVIPVYLQVSTYTRMKRYYHRTGHITFEQIRRCLTDTADFQNFDLLLKLNVPQYVVLKDTNIDRNCAKIAQYVL